MAGITLALLAMIVAVTAIDLMPPLQMPVYLRMLTARVMRLLPMALLASQFAAMYLTRVTLKK
jgi:hypothetical protein